MGIGRAFSLVELMVVVAIIAVFAAIAVPSYIDYIAKTRVTSCWPVIDVVKNDAMEYFARNGTWPNATQLGFDAANNMDLDSPGELNEFLTAFTMTSATTGSCSANIMTLVWTLDHDALGISDASVYTGYLYIAEMPNGHIAAMCRETLDGSTFGHAYIGDICTYSDIESFNMALCS